MLLIGGTAAQALPALFAKQGKSESEHSQEVAMEVLCAGQG